MRKIYQVSVCVCVCVYTPQDSEDLSDFVYLRAHAVKFSGTFTSGRTLDTVTRYGKQVPR